MKIRDPLRPAWLMRLRERRAPMERMRALDRTIHTTRAFFAEAARSPSNSLDPGILNSAGPIISEIPNQSGGPSGWGRKPRRHSHSDGK